LEYETKLKPFELEKGDLEAEISALRMRIAVMENEECESEFLQARPEEDKFEFQGAFLDRVEAVIIS